MIPVNSAPASASFSNVVSRPKAVSSIARAILRDLRKPGIGEKVWNRFNAPKKLQLWYYRNFADTFREMMPGQLSDELHEIVEALEA